MLEASPSSSTSRSDRDNDRSISKGSSRRARSKNQSPTRSRPGRPWNVASLSNTTVAELTGTARPESRVRALRRALGISPEELARRTGLALSTVRRIDAGVHKAKSASVREALGRGFWLEEPTMGQYLDGQPSDGSETEWVRTAVMLAHEFARREQWKRHAAEASRVAIEGRARTRAQLFADLCDFAIDHEDKDMALSLVFLHYPRTCVETQIAALSDLIGRLSVHATRASSSGCDVRTVGTETVLNDPRSPLDCARLLLRCAEEQRRCEDLLPVAEASK